MKRLSKKTLFGCPVCGQKSSYRMERARKWKVLLIGCSYACPNCHSHYIRLIGNFFIVTERGFVPFYEPESRRESRVYSGERSDQNDL